jgi:signal transduction histidine kinase
MKPSPPGMYTRLRFTADRLVLREAITNVVDNAIKHGPHTSTIDIRVRADGHQALLTVPSGRSR